MKKILILLVTIAFVFTFVSCQDGSPEPIHEANEETYEILSSVRYAMYEGSENPDPNQFVDNGIDFDCDWRFTNCVIEGAGIFDGAIINGTYVSTDDNRKANLTVQFSNGYGKHTVCYDIKDKDAASYEAVVDGLTYTIPMKSIEPSLKTMEVLKNMASALKLCMANQVADTAAVVYETESILFDEVWDFNNAVVVFPSDSVLNGAIVEGYIAKDDEDTVGALTFQFSDGFGVHTIDVGFSEGDKDLSATIDTVKYIFPDFSTLID